MFDVHTHLNDDKLFPISEQIVKSLKEDGIEKVIVPSCDKKMIENALILIEKYNNVFAALGIHPSDTSDFDENIASLIEKTAKNPKIVAVGEIGFDNHYEGSNLKIQEEVFVKQLKIAKKVNLPVILHIRDAWDEFFKTLSDHRELFTNGVDIHCFDGNVEIAKKLLDNGFYISLTALSVENKQRLREMVNYLPLDRIMFETDSPYLVPSIYRNEQKFNVPNNVNYVAECVSKIKGISFEKLDEITTNNALKLFRKIGEFNANNKK